MNEEGSCYSTDSVALICFWFLDCYRWLFFWMFFGRCTLCILLWCHSVFKRTFYFFFAVWVVGTSGLGFVGV